MGFGRPGGTSRTYSPERSRPLTSTAVSIRRPGPRPLMNTTRSIASAIRRRGTVVTASWIMFDAMERCARRVRVYGCDSTGMAGIPGLQHVEGFPAPDLTDHDPVRAQP